MMLLFFPYVRSMTNHILKTKTNQHQNLPVTLLKDLDDETRGL